MLKRGKLRRSEGIKLINRQTIKEVDDKGYKYLSIPEFDKFKEREMKENESEAEHSAWVFKEWTSSS